MFRGTALALFALLVMSAPIAPRAHANEALAAKAGCGICHALDKKGVGPSYRDMAARYKGDPAARQMLIDRVRKGSKDVWGKIPMTPVGPSRINDADLAAVVDWILRQ